MGEGKEGRRSRNWSNRTEDQEAESYDCVEWAENGRWEMATGQLEEHRHGGMGGLGNQYRWETSGIGCILAAEGSIRGGGPDLPLEPTREKPLDFGGGGGGDEAVAQGSSQRMCRATRDSWTVPEHTWSPMAEISTSLPQVEHLMAGRKPASTEAAMMKQLPPRPSSREKG